MMRHPQLTIVIPVYRSASTLRALVERIEAALDSAQITFEIILVDDSSPDDSWSIACQIQRDAPGRVTAIQLMRNFGQHNALMCGFRHARGDFIVSMDDDLQNPPEEVSKMLDGLRNGAYDLVYGIPAQKKHALGRNLGSWLVNAFFRIVFRTRVTVSSFRIIRRELLDAILSYDLNFTYIDGLLAWNTQRVGQIAVDHHPRSHGRSGYSLSKLVVLAMNLFTNFSLLPLQLVSLAGFGAALGGFGAGAYYLAKYLFAQIAVPGYASTIIAILALGGLQLLGLGILGEYLGRVHLNMNRKPQYTVRHVWRRASAPDVGTVDDEPCIAEDTSRASSRAQSPEQQQDPS